MTSGYRVLRSAQCDADLERIFDHLLQSYRDLGDPAMAAYDRAANRVRAIEDDLLALGMIPFQGTLEPKILAGLRHVTKNMAVFYFISDDHRETVRVLGVFFGGQDHHNQILRRIKESMGNTGAG